MGHPGNGSRLGPEAFQSCFLSYYALVPHRSRGLTRARLAQVLDLAFGEHGVRREDHYAITAEEWPAT